MIATKGSPNRHSAWRGLALARPCDTLIAQLKRSESPKVPNLFIVGAPKSGTTALCHYLGQHPEVYMAPKELQHFGSDLDFRKQARPGLAEYVEAFTTPRNERWLGEGSVWYLFSSKAAFGSPASGSWALACINQAATV